MWRGEIWITSSISASSHTIPGAEPPSSIKAGIIFLAAILYKYSPVFVEVLVSYVEGRNLEKKETFLNQQF